ncbi:MAG: methylamine dehydrogenase (amicyanin) light chain [Proteobacteria bacterium]|nr:methylamine dehydrogenase (amicyanin) light chain [Pseudomonadota bacterium]
MNRVKRFDVMTERLSRALAGRTSRRGLLNIVGGVLVGTSGLPLLPVARGSDKGADTPGPSGTHSEHSTGNPQDPGDPTSCDYWRYCAIDGALCSCCGGSVNSCPPGTEMSPVTWIGTCRNPADDRHYIISYNDCCGGAACGRCGCHKNEGDRPIVRPQNNNEITWCFGTQSQAYSCSTARNLGVALNDA